LLRTGTGSRHARIRNEPRVVQSCLRGSVTFVTSALLSYRNSLLGYLTEMWHNGYVRYCYVS